VVIKPALQMRARLNLDAIKEHAEHYRRARAGKLEPGERPYDLIQVDQLPDKTRAVAHGNHRRAGMDRALIVEQDVLLAQGTLRQAAHHGARANVGNISVPYTADDKAAACKKLFAIYGNISGRVIAEMAGVSPATADRHRPPELADQPRLGKDGKTRKNPAKKEVATAARTPGSSVEGKADATTTDQSDQFKPSAAPTADPGHQASAGSASGPDFLRAADSPSGDATANHPQEDDATDAAADEGAKRSASASGGGPSSKSPKQAGKPTADRTGYTDLHEKEGPFVMGRAEARRFLIGDLFIEVEFRDFLDGRVSGYVRLVRS
jgi:hypothetical protein